MRLSIFTVAAVLLAALSAPAVAADAYTNAIVGLRAGPGAGFPRVGTLPAGHVVRVHGCLPEWEWCELSFRGERGWVGGEYLEFLVAGDRLPPSEYGRRGSLPTVGFDPEDYWDRWYADRPWYGERDDFARRWEEMTPGFATGSTGRQAPPPGIAKKGGFCPPGQRKKGHC